MRSWLYRLITILSISAVMLGIENILANGFNDPKVPFEATVCLIGLIVVFAIYIFVVYSFSKKWSALSEEDPK